MRYPKLRELREVIRAIVKGPYTNPFPFKPHEPFERFRGKPEFHVDDCTGCTACVQVCPAKALEFIDSRVNGKVTRSLIVHWDICIACGQCQANCLTGKGIMLSRDFELSTVGERTELKQEIEKELMTCDCCGTPTAPRDQYRWIAERLGPLSFTNSSLILFYLAKLSIALFRGEMGRFGTEMTRQERMRILCASCRRQAVLQS